MFLFKLPNKFWCIHVIQSSPVVLKMHNVKYHQWSQSLHLQQIHQLYDKIHYKKKCFERVNFTT